MCEGSVLYRYLIILVVSLASSLVAQGSVALELTGALTQGSLLIGRVPPGTEVELMKHQVRVDEDGLFVFGLGRDTPSEIVLITRHGDDGAETHRLTIAQREYQEQRVEGVPQKTVSPLSPEVLKRVLREAALVKKARDEDNRSQDFLSGFVRPLEGPITGVYGSRRVYNGKPGRPHYGLDIAAPKGTDVFAPAPGVVRLVHDDMFYSGGTLILEHGHGLSSTFIHLSEVLAIPGQRVEAGDLIARVGSTGRATGPHLDWRINWFDVRLDPALVLEHFPAVVLSQSAH
jgi:murein DD-endopeptidase MepM/ murein hydrolase activator NlpD